MAPIVWPTAEQVQEISDLMWSLHRLTGVPCSVVASSVLSTRTLRAMGADPGGRIDADQAEACVRILRRWERQAKERRNQ